VYDITYSGDNITSTNIAILNKNLLPTSTFISSLREEHNQYDAEYTHKVPYISLVHINDAWRHWLWGGPGAGGGFDECHCSCDV
jgi:hypothetical protein